jgi:hypothetical protein
MGGETGDMSFLDHIPQAPNLDLPPKSTESTRGVGLINIFPTGDICDNGSSVCASAVLKLYDHLYNSIMQTGSQATENMEV